MAIIPSFLLFMIQQEGNMIQTGTWLFYMLILLTVKYSSSHTFWRCYNTILVIAIVFFCIQEISWYTTGSRMSGLIPFFDFSFYEDGGNQQMQEFQQHTNRSSSIFMEPAVFAKYLIPGLIVNLRYTTKYFIRILGFLIIFLLLRSGVGFLLAAVCIFCYVLYIPIKTRVNKILLILSLCGVLAGGLYVVRSNEFVNSQFERVDEISSSAGEDASGFQRVIRGYLLYAGMSVEEKICGIGSKNISYAISQSPYRLFFADNEDVYLNGIQAILVGGGIVGLALFFLMMYKFQQKQNRMVKMTTICLIFSSFVAAEYLSATMFLYLGIILFEQNKDSKVLCNLKFI